MKDPSRQSTSSISESGIPLSRPHLTLSLVSSRITFRSNGRKQQEEYNQQGCRTSDPIVSVLSLICPKGDKRMSRIEPDVNVAGADPSNVSTPTTMNIAEIPVIDDETSPMEEPSSLLDQPMKADEDETSEEDEDIYLKRLQTNQKQIVALTEEDDDDEEEEEDEEEQGGNDVSSTTRRHPSLSRVF